MSTIDNHRSEIHSEAISSMSMCALSDPTELVQVQWHVTIPTLVNYMAVCQNLVPLVNIKIAGKWMFIPLNMVLIGIDPYPHWELLGYESFKSWCLTLLPAQHLLWFGNGSLRIYVYIEVQWTCGTLLWHAGKEDTPILACFINGTATLVPTEYPPSMAGPWGQCQSCMYSNMTKHGFLKHNISMQKS